MGVERAHLDPGRVAAVVAPALQRSLQSGDEAEVAVKASTRRESFVKALTEAKAALRSTLLTTRLQGFNPC